MKTQNPKSVRRRQYVFNIIIVVALIFAFIRMSAFYSGERPLILDRQIKTNKDKLVFAPELNFFLENRKALKLTDDQAIKINALNEKYNRKTKNLKEALQSASKNLSLYLDERKNEGTTLKDIQGYSQGVSQMSRELYEIRKTYFQQAFVLLTKPQRETVYQKFLKTKSIKPYFSLLYPDISPVLREREDVP